MQSLKAIPEEVGREIMSSFLKQKEINNFNSANKKPAANEEPVANKEPVPEGILDRLSRFAREYGGLGDDSDTEKSFADRIEKEKTAREHKQR